MGLGNGGLVIAFINVCSKGYNAIIIVGNV